MKAIAAGYKVPAEPERQGRTVRRQRHTADARPARLPIISRRRSPMRRPRARPTTVRLPPDLSVIVKAREGGAEYVYSI